MSTALEIFQKTTKLTASNQVLLTSLGTLCAGYILFFIRENERKKSILLALKNEIYSNSYEMIEVGATAKIMMKDKNEKKVLKQLVYSEPRLKAFDTLIGNDLASAVRGSIHDIYFLYAKFREFDLVFRKKI